MNIQKTSSKIDSLQAIRAFAAISVMLFHGTQILDERLGYQFLSNIFMAGFSGVDVFFVLSGFIILYTSKPGTNNIAKFLKARFIRIYPIYWVVTILLIIAFFIAPTAEQAYKGNLNVILGSFTLFPQKTYVIGVAWTLTYEMIFYLVFAATYFKNPRFLFYTFVAWITVILIFFFANIKTDSLLIAILLNPIILNFAFGCLVAYFYKRNINLNYSGWFFWGGLILFTLMWSMFYQLRLSDPDVFTGDMDRIMLFGIPSAFLIFGALFLPFAVPRLLVYLGDASYSLYLVHGTVLSLLIKIVTKFNQVELFGTFFGAIVLFIATLIISCCFYTLVEKNLLTFLKKMFVSRLKQTQSA